jgi:hypothetical protein
MDAEARIRDVKRVESRSGNIRWVLTDDAGNEYTTFRPQIGEEAERHVGRRARIRYHEEERNGFRNVYLDGIEPAPEQHEGTDGAEADEVAWATAVDAAPWLLGTTEPGKEIPPDELYDKLEPFKRRVAEDIREGDDPAQS